MDMRQKLQSPFRCINCELDLLISIMSIVKKNEGSVWVDHEDSPKILVGESVLAL